MQKWGPPARPCGPSVGVERISSGGRPRGTGPGLQPRAPLTCCPAGALLPVAPRRRAVRFTSSGASCRGRVGLPAPDTHTDKHIHTLVQTQLHTDTHTLV